MAGPDAFNPQIEIGKVGLVIRQVFIIARDLQVEIAVQRQHITGETADLLNKAGADIDFGIRTIAGDRQAQPGGITCGDAVIAAIHGHRVAIDGGTAVGGNVEVIDAIFRR